jgi:hypothetical protein
VGAVSWLVRIAEGVGRTYIGGLESSLEHSNGVILGCDIAEVLRSTVSILVKHKRARAT